RGGAEPLIEGQLNHAGAGTAAELEAAVAEARLEARAGDDAVTAADQGIGQITAQDLGRRVDAEAEGGRVPLLSGQVEGPEDGDLDAVEDGDGEGADAQR